MIPVRQNPIPRTNPKGKSCYALHRRGGAAPRVIVLHWGGLDVGHCRRTLIQRGLSSHYGVGLDGVEQWVPVTARAYHAGTPANDWAVGVDLCQSPRVDYLEETLDRGHEVEVVENPTSRGHDRIVSLDTRIADIAGAFIPELARELGIPLRVPRDSDGEVSHAVLTQVELERFLAEGGGVLGHHHLSPRKWDVACWWELVFRGDNRLS